jgi:glycosyltransferase involved in cell wall biosynthesis
MKPKISVILAAYNEEKLLPRCLTYLQKQNYPKDDYEIIVVDNNSTDRTAVIGKEFGVRVVSYTEINGCGAARKYGSDVAKGEILAFTDPDCIVPEDWLTKIDKYLKETKAVCISGPGMPDKETIWLKGIFGFYNWFYVVNHKFHKPIVWGYNMAMLKEAYDAVGGFDKMLLSSDDWELAVRLQKKFGKNSVRYIEDLKAYTNPRKQQDIKVFARYARDGVKNYTDLIIFGKKKAVGVFNVR